MSVDAFRPVPGPRSAARRDAVPLRHPEVAGQATARERRRATEPPGRGPAVRAVPVPARSPGVRARTIAGRQAGQSLFAAHPDARRSRAAASGGRPLHTDRTIAIPAPHHAGGLPPALRLRSPGRRGGQAAGRGCRPEPRGPDRPRRQVRQGPPRAASPAAGQASARLPRGDGRPTGRGVLLPVARRRPVAQGVGLRAVPGTAVPKRHSASGPGQGAPSPRPPPHLRRPRPAALVPRGRGSRCQACGARDVHGPSVRRRNAAIPPSDRRTVPGSHCAIERLMFGEVIPRRTRP